MMYIVNWAYPKGHENYREYGDNETFYDLGLAYDCFDELKDDGAVWVKITQRETFYGQVVDESTIEEFGEEI